MDKKKEINIRCEGKENYTLDKLIPFQGNLKSIDKPMFDKLKQSLIKDGLPLGFHIWKDKNKTYILDGHHRHLALKSLEVDGYFIPAIPCTPVIAKNKKEAAKVVLISNSKYAEMNQQSLSDFMVDFELRSEDLFNLDLPNISMDDFNFKDPMENLNTTNTSQEGTNPEEEWKDMPEFNQPDATSFRHIIVHFNDQESVDEFSELIGQDLTDKTKSIWHPKQERMDTESKRYSSDQESE
jgi:hypothetical protein